jgi:hypothetical protein
MADKIRLEVKDEISNGIKAFVIKTGSVKNPGTLLHRSWAAVGLQLLNFAVNGSPKNTVVPPVDTGLLRGSGSVFIGSMILGTSQMITGFGDKGTPATSHSEKEGIITIGFNTAYATRQHENLTPAGDYYPGKKSIISGDVQGKFLESHLKTDGQELMRLYARLMKKGL